MVSGVSDGSVCPMQVGSPCGQSPCGQSQRSRRLWLQTNQPLLRMFLSYCSLHGSHGGGLASVRMELILLLQESHQVSRCTETYGRPGPVAVDLHFPLRVRRVTRPDTVPPALALSQPLP